ncbi:MAG: flavodoxin family protein [Candidatus Hodarchaeota archaeon]
MKKTLIVIPQGENKLEKIATELKSALQRVIKFKKTEMMALSDIDSTDCFLEHDILILGTPTIKKDISWPVQVKIDAMLHKEKCDLSTKVVSGFTSSDDFNEANRCLEAILWAFKETNATVLDGLVILDSFTNKEKTKKLKEFIDTLKEIKNDADSS